MKHLGLIILFLLLCSSFALADSIHLNEEFTLDEGETALLSGSSIKLTLQSIETPSCVSGTSCTKKATILIQQTSVPDKKIFLYEGESQNLEKIPSFLDSSEITFLSMDSIHPHFIIQTLQVLLDKDSYLPQEPITIRARNTGARPIVVVEGSTCGPAFSVFQGDNYLKLTSERECPPGIGRVLLRANETKIVGTWDQKFYDNCKLKNCDGEYVTPGDYILVINNIQKRISLYDPNKIYIIVDKENAQGSPITVAAQNMGNAIVDIQTSPGCVSGFAIKDTSGKKIMLNPPGTCKEQATLKLLPGHFQELSTWNQLSYDHCINADCQGKQVPLGTYTIQLTAGGKTIEREITITTQQEQSKADQMPPEPLPAEKGFFARLWEKLFT